MLASRVPAAATHHPSSTPTPSQVKALRREAGELRDIVRGYKEVEARVRCGGWLGQGCGQVPRGCVAGWSTQEGWAGPWSSAGCTACGHPDSPPACPTVPQREAARRRREEEAAAEKRSPLQQYVELLGSQDEAAWAEWLIGMGQASRPGAGWGRGAGGGAGCGRERGRRTWTAARRPGAPAHAPTHAALSLPPRTDSPPCCAQGADVPKLFRHSGKIRNRHLSKRETEKLVKEVWRERMQDPGEGGGARGAWGAWGSEELGVGGAGLG